MAQEITLPVKLQLENLQSIMKEMRSQLGTLKVDSSGYKKLEGVINGIEKRIQDIQVIASRPIMDGKQFVAIEKDVSHIYDDITKLGMEAGKIKFSDLQLTGDQKAKLQEFDNQLKTIKDSMKNIKEAAKSAFLDSDEGKNWVDSGHAEAVGQSFQQLTKTIAVEVQKQRDLLKEAQNVQNDYQTRLAAQQKLNNFIAKKGNLKDPSVMAAEEYNKIFLANGNFKGGDQGRSLLEKWLEEQFKLDPEFTRSIIQGGGRSVQKAFMEANGEVMKAIRNKRNEIGRSLNEETKTTRNGATYAEAVASQQANLDQVVATQASLSAKEQEQIANQKQLQTEYDKTVAKREAYQASAASAAQSLLKMDSATQRAKVQLDSLNNTVKEGQAKLASLDSATSKLQGISNFVNRYVGAYAIIRKVTTAIRNAFNNIKELDKTITDIAVVTNMSQEDLWNKVGQYTQMAQEYGVTTNDVYKVSQLFYQQGLQTSQVMSLTTETLKMAKIAGMGYTEATNAMTVAVRAFNIEMGQAQQVTDTYSALAAKFAVSSQEIANAMEKTASSAANVGMSLQSTSAFMSVMIQTTRESAQNIGSALKSIISRYGEMKASPSSLINVDGEEVAFNKVDTALKSVGISIKDASGQFRDFDDVIMELAAKWNTLDNNTQRYIATVMAGNRQQSRFIALVSNYDELSRAISVANNAENASIVQVAKTMDSLESKTNQLKNAFSQLYLDLHIETGLKGIYDWLTRIITTVGKLGTLSGAIPTLMNIFGFGSGTKRIFNEINNSIQAKKLTIETDNSQFEKQKTEIENFLANPHDLTITTKVNDTELRALEEKLTVQQASSIAMTMTGINSRLNAPDLMADLIANQSKLANADEARKFLEDRGFDTSEIEKLTPVLQAFSQAAIDATGKVSQLGNSAETGAQAEDQKTQVTQQGTQVQTEQTDATHQVANAEEDLTQKIGKNADELEYLSDKEKSAIAASELEKQASEDNTRQKQQEAQGSKEAEIADRQEAGASREAAKASGSGGWSGHPVAMKITGIATGAARMLGTAITAAGAGHQDKSTETREYSKIWTGIGNGLSMAGTGASMGMTLGPWGAVIGGITGLLIGGLGAVIDGWTVTAKERLQLLKAEEKEASDANLKQQAKVTDLSGQIDNIKQLQKAMYNSTDDMQAYTDAMNTMASEYPELISTYDSMGNAIIDVNAAEQMLIQTRLDAANTARDAAVAADKTTVQQIDIVTDLMKQLNTVSIEQAELKYDNGSTDSEIMAINTNEGRKFISTYEYGGKDQEENGDIFASLYQFVTGLDLLSDLPKEVRSAVDNYLENSGNTKAEYNLDELELLFNLMLNGNKEYNIESYKLLNEWEQTRTQDFLNELEEGSGYEDLASIEISTEELQAFIEAFNNIKDDLGISGTAEDIFGFTAENTPYEQYQKAMNWLNNQLTLLTNSRKANSESIDYAVAQSSLLSQINASDIQNETKTAISKSGIFSSLLQNMLLSAMPKDKGYLGLNDWQTKDVLGYDGAVQIYSEQLLSQFKDYSITQLDNFVSTISDFSKYRNAEDLITAAKLDINKIEEEGTVESSLVKEWAQATQDNRDRILKAIYAYDGDTRIGHKVNSAMSGLESIGWYDTPGQYSKGDLEGLHKEQGNYALDIAWAIGEGKKIIPQYSEYFTSQLIEINNLATEGYTELARNRLTILNSMATTLGSITDSKQQQELFGLITSIDFMDYSSIQTAISSLKDYAETKNIADIDADVGAIGQLYDELVLASQRILFNISTLAQEVTTKITNATSKIDSIIATNKSGLSFDKAIEEYNNLVLKLGQDAKFDELFIYDSNLEKYVYSAEGLKAAIEQQQGELSDNITQLTTTYDNYTALFKAIPESTLEEDFNFDDYEDPQAELQSALSHYDIPEELASYQEQLINGFLSTTDRAHTWNEFQKYIQEQIDTYKIEKEKADQILSNFESNKKNQYFQNIDWSALALGNDYYGTNRTLLDELAPLVGKNVSDSWNTILESYLATIENESVREATRTKINDEIIQTKTSQYQTAISEIINYSSGQTLSQATKDLFNNAKVAEHQIANSAETAILTAKGFLEELAKSIGQAGYTLEQYNQDAKSILKATLNNGSKEKSLLDFISEDSIGADTLEGLANVFGKRLDELVDVATGQIQGQLGQYMSYDFLAGEYDITGTFEQFIEALQADFGIIIWKGTKQYIEALKTWNERVINENNEIHKAVSEELNKVLSAKGGDQLNLAQTFGQLGDKINQDLLDKLTSYGADLSGGILTIHDGANIPAIVQELANIAAKNGLLIPEELRALTDAINAVLDTMVSNIKNGIKGSLSVSGARDLATWAKNNLKIDLDFTRTKEGLKLSTEQAEQLYNELVKVDSISAQIVLDELNESIEESITSTKVLNKEIVALRSTTESDDFKFMDKEIPSGQNNPLNYFENWTKAFKALDEAAKGRGQDKNKIAYQDFYNIINEMSNLAATSGQTFKLGQDFEVNATNAAELIERGAAALSVASDGTLKVDLSQLGIDFATGASNLKQDVGKGIQEVAKSQIEMLDSMIQLLETIVAMEDLGDLADEGEGDKNVIEIDDILPELKIDSNGKITQIGEFSQAYTKWRDSILHQIKEINEDGSKNSDFNKDLADAMKAIKIGDFSFEEILGFSPSELASKGEDFMKQYSAVLNSFWKAAQSGDYDLNNLFSSIREVLAGSGFDGEISIGDMKLVGKYNTVLMVDKDGNITTDDGTEFKGTNAFENAARYQKARNLDVLKNASTTWNEETETVDVKNNIVTNVSYDLTKGTYLITFDDGTTATADSEAAANLAISTYATMMGKSIDGEITSNEGPQHFTIHKNGWMDLEFTLENGEVTVKETGTFGDGGHADNATSAVNKVLEEEQKKTDAAAQAASGQTLESNIDNLNLQLSTDATATVDISDIQITTTGTPQPVELTPTPDFKLGEDAEVKVNVDNITPESEGKLNPFTYDQLDATITTINAIYDQVPNKDQVNLHEIKYDTLQAAIKEVQAKFNDKPNIDGITLEEPTYSKMLGILLASIYLTRAEESSIDPTGITIGDNEVEIADIINALLTGQLVLNGTDVPAIAGTITLADGTVVPIDSIKAEIAQIIFELAEGTSLDLDFEALGLKTEYEAPEAIVTQHIEVNYVYDENDPIGTLNRLRGIDNGIHDKVYSETFGRYIEDNFSLMDMGEGSDSFTFNVGGSFNIQDVELPEGWNLDEGSGLLTTTSEYYIPTQLRIEQNEIDDNSLDDLQDKYEQLEEPVTAQVEIEDLTGEEFEQILENQQAVEENSPIKVEVGEEIQTNDETKEHLHQIYQRQVDIENKSELIIDISSPNAPGVISDLGAVAEAAASIPTDIGINVTISTSGSLPSFSGKGGGGGASYLMQRATGNVGLADAKGTLMGELGPELVVSNGHYFVAGQNGAEFVDLSNDAIVFNHLQTEQLLKHGMSKQRGQAVTNERNAVSFATGNANGGPAMASAKAALAALRQLRAQWQAIAGMNTKDLAGLGGSGGGGGGGGGNKQADPKAFVKQLEIWYNWLQRIAVLEEKINYEEAKRNEISSSFFPNGKEYVQSQKESLDYLKEQAAVQMSLVKSQQEYFEQRRAEMNSANNPFSALYTFDEYGQLKYKDGGLEQLSQLVGRDSLTGQANMSAEEQYSRLVSMGYGKYMDYDSSGNPIDKEQDDWYVSAVQAFWDKIDSDKEEMQSLHDSIEEHKKALLEEEQKMNEILHEIEDNQIQLEDKVLKAIEESRQREIDELQKQRDAFEESSQKLIDGLSEQLQKEQDMYSNNESQKELTGLQRQLQILQRSGGSASQIASLQKEISQKQQDAYFEAQQAQIDALQEASDKQLEKLDKQIDLMTETLEYQKLHGMLWTQVYEVLNGTPEQIAQFIKENTSEYWSQSAAQVAVNMREDLFEAEKFKAGIDYLGGINQAAEIYSKKAIEEEAKKKREEEEKAKAAAAAAAAQASQSSSGGSSSSSGSGGASTPNSSKDNDNNNNNNKVSDVNGYSYSYTYGNQKRSEVINTSNPVVALAAAAKEITDATKREQQNSKGIQGMLSTAVNYAKAVTSIKVDKITNGKKKASGGYVGHGIYELGERGTETVLTAEQTQVLRNNILSTRPNSLISLLKSYNEGYDGINDNIKDVNQITDNSTIIEQATVEMHVSKIANDYDAQRAGEKALEKMISIARKTQAQNRVGR